MLVSEKLIGVLDLVISEYGWSLEYCLKLPHDVLMTFVKAINERKHQELYLFTKFSVFAVNQGFNGKMESVDKVFNIKKDEPMDEDAWKGQLKNLWMRLGKDPEEFEQKWANKEDIKL